MKKIKVLIIIISIIAILLVCAIIIINKTQDDNLVNTNSIKENITNNISNTMSNNSSENTNIVPKIQSVKSKNDFYTVKSCAEKYINYIVKADKEAVYSLVDETYMNQKNINKNNILDMVYKINEPQIFTATKMEVAKIENKEIYLVYGNIREDKLNDRGEEKDFNITVILNKSNKSFSILPGILNIETSYSLVGNNKRNEYNQYSLANVENQTMANIYFTDYKSKILNNPQEAYNLLDEEYKTKRFKNFSDYQQYINNDDRIKKAKLNKYIINEYNEYTLYTCIDQYNNYYIFKETAVMQYTSMLDEYTIDSEAFKNEYKNLSMKEKVEKNINKFIRMINNKDYESAYNILNKEFKNNYFKTLEEFKIYINNNFYDYCDITFNKFEQEGDIGIYKVNVNGIVNDRDVQFSKTIIMKLGTGTDFEMSFDVEE